MAPRNAPHRNDLEMGLAKTRSNDREAPFRKVFASCPDARVSMIDFDVTRRHGLKGSLRFSMVLRKGRRVAFTAFCVGPSENRVG